MGGVLTQVQNRIGFAFCGGLYCIFDVALSRSKRAWGVLWIFVHIRSLGDGLYRFRSYSESLLIERKSNQNALAP
ncbi:hypothetical protein, partial [Pseudomonas kitaguniensis]|uniref:hypothetical protein n=1 Tax=Pseudomonas kitaguniensis TaxID=2607908 RepID=UPI003CFD6D43